MKKQLKYIVLLAAFIFPGCNLFTDETDSSDKPITIWLIGDSTLTDYSKEKDYKTTKYPKTGWGQVFFSYLSGSPLDEIKEWLKADSVVLENRARGGRSTRSFFEEGRWREVQEALMPGDFVFIQFGHNDASVDKTRRYVDTLGYKEYLRMYVAQTRDKGATPVLITPVARNYPWENETLMNIHGDYYTSMMEIASITNTELIDLTALSMAFFTEKGRDYVTKNYFMNLEAGVYEAYPEGLDDNTHFQPEGAMEVASLVYQAIVAKAHTELDEE